MYEVSIHFLFCESYTDMDRRFIQGRMNCPSFFSYAKVLQRPYQKSIAKTWTEAFTEKENLLIDSDGAAALVLVSGETVLKLGLQVIAKISGYADAAQVIH